MAIYYFNASVISRSSGRSATASAAYRAAEKIQDIKTGVLHDYRKKKGVDEKFILAPNSAPTWVYNRSSLWNEVERVEHRINSQLAREIQLAIPRELNRNQQIELVTEYANDLFVSEGMVADIAFHELSSHNPHAHIMLTMREIDQEGFNKKKNRDWNKRELLEKQREAWSSYANLALEKAGISERIDHRTLEQQGINRIPQIHLGSAVTAMMKRGVATNKGDRWLEIEQANKQIESLERSLAKVKSEINTEKKVITSSVDRVRTEYKNTAKLIQQELGNDISNPRLDLEIYLRANSQSEIIKQSAVYQKLEKDNPSLAQHYVKAISSVAGIYQRLSNQKTPDLDGWAKKLVNHNLADFYREENNRDQNIQPQRRRRRRM